jgi:hypothetical protein
MFMNVQAVPNPRCKPVSLWCNIYMCMVPTSVNNDPLPSIENSADNALDEADVNCFEATECGVLPKPIIASRGVALFDDGEEQCLRFLEVEPWCPRHIDFDNSLKFPKESFKYHMWLLVLGFRVAVNGRLVLTKGCCVRWRSQGDWQ